MSDEKTPDVTVEPPAEAAAANEPVDQTEGAEAQIFARGKGRRGKSRTAATAPADPTIVATEAVDEQVDDVVVVDEPPAPGTAAEGDEGLSTDVSASDVTSERAADDEPADASTGDLVDPELFDPSEVADAPRAPHPLKPVVEALIFASPEPLTVKAMVRLLEEHTKEDIEAALVEVRDTYLRSDGLQLVEVAGGYQIVTRPELYEWVRRLFKERTTSKLSVQALETLAVIAYKQPVTSGEIAEIRGVSATTGVLNTLLDRKLVKIVGRKQVVGRPFMYGTTREFLDKFGLRDLSDLPKVEDMSEALGFDLPSPVDEGDGNSLPFEGPAEPRLFEETDLEPLGAEPRRDSATEASAASDVTDDEATSSVADAVDADDAPSDETS